MGIRSKFKGKNTKKCILKAVLKKNATAVVKLCPKNYLFCIPTIFLPQIFWYFYTDISAISVTFCNSGTRMWLVAFSIDSVKIERWILWCWKPLGIGLCWLEHCIADNGDHQGIWLYINSGQCTVYSVQWTPSRSSKWFPTHRRNGSASFAELFCPSERNTYIENI